MSSTAVSSTAKSDVASPEAIADVELPEGSRYDFRHDLSPTAPEVENYHEGDGSYGYAHSYETGSSVDGPGIRITLFLSGCPLKCQYCHNPDTWRLKHGLRITLDRVVTRLSHFAPALRAMKGGLTISGGEVLLQSAFSRRILGAAKKMGLHTAIQTSGFLGARATDDYLENVDLVIMDLKSGDPETYRRVTGQELAPTLRFAERLAGMNKPMWIRFTLVPGLTDDPEDVAQIARFAAGLGNVERVDVLPFHQMGRYKWERLGLTYALGDVEPPSAGLVDRTLSIFRNEGLTAY